ncbi:MAG: TIGR00725 family protein [candidate division KSB1 bacterium]|nr:TIGR00725 family protein [candidate division KSB1 bacterium]
MASRKPIIGVIGGGAVNRRIYKLAYEVGREIAVRGAILVSGGLGGVMEAASHGASEAGGLVLGILPGFSASEANDWVDVSIVTGMSEARNVIIARTADALIAVDGEFGTLSEIAFGLRFGKPVIGLETWEVSPEIVKARSPKDAVEIAIKHILGR